MIPKKKPTTGAKRAHAVIEDMISSFGKEGLYRRSVRMLSNLMYMYCKCQDDVTYPEIEDSVEFSSMLIDWFEGLLNEEVA